MHTPRKIAGEKGPRRRAAERQGQAAGAACMDVRSRHTYLAAPVSFSGRFGSTIDDLPFPPYIVDTS
jgi:hypothetical protein